MCLFNTDRALRRHKHTLNNTKKGNSIAKFIIYAILCMSSVYFTKKENYKICEQERANLLIQ